MPAPPQLIRKLHALTNRVTEALKVMVDREMQYHFDPLDAVPWFEKWIKIRAELMAAEPELDDIADCAVPKPVIDKEDPWYAGRGYIPRDPILRMHKEFRSVWDILNHPSRQAPQVSIDREGVFVGGQPFDAMMAVRSIFSAAKKSITLVDNYVSEDTLHLIAGKAEPVAARILTQTMKPNQGAFVSAAKLLQMQFPAGPPLEVRTTAAFHDRFILIDDAECFHFGTSIKDAAKKNAFMFSRIEEPAVLTLLKGTFAKEWAAATPVPL